MLRNLESAKSRGLRGNVGYVDAWVAWLRGSNFYVGCVGYVGQNIFYVGQHFTWVIIFTWVAWVKYIFAWVNFFCVNPNFFALVKIVYVAPKLFRG